MAARMEPARDTRSAPARSAAREVRATVRRLVTRSRLAVFLGTLLRWTAVGYLLAGASVLVLRASHAFEPAPLPAFLTPLLLVLPFALLAASRRALSGAAAASWVDVSCGGTGVVLTGMETPDPRWEATLARTLEDTGRLPALRVGRPAGFQACSALFLAAALWVEIPEPQPGPSPELFEAMLATLTEKLQALEENVELEEDLATELSERLGRLQELVAENASQESLFEALDALESRLGLESAEVRQELENASRDLFEAVFDHLRDPQAAQGALERALAALRKGGLAKNLPESLEALLGSGLELPEGIDVTGAEFLELAQMLAELMQDRAGGLAKAGLIDSKLLKLAERFGNLDDLTDHVCDEECKEGG